MAQNVLSRDYRLSTDVERSMRLREIACFEAQTAQAGVDVVLPSVVTTDVERSMRLREVAYFVDLTMQTPDFDLNEYRVMVEIATLRGWYSIPYADLPAVARDFVWECWDNWGCEDCEEEQDDYGYPPREDRLPSEVAEAVYKLLPEWVHHPDQIGRLATYLQRVVFVDGGGK